MDPASVPSIDDTEEIRVRRQRQDVREKLQTRKPSVLLDDNPCWGDAQHCGLQHLLSLLSQRPLDTVLLQETDDYLVLNKPPDLRMDGPYRATVHKLLTYWYPSPSLLLVESGLQQTQPLAQPQPQHLQQSQRQTQLLIHTITRSLHKFNDLSDNALRPCHQLDYATSGCLLVARSAEAAKKAGMALSRRHAAVQKHYLALVYGSVQTGRTTKKIMDSGTTCSPCPLPCISKQTYETAFSKMEETYRQKRAKKRHDTFVGYLPAHAVLERWKSAYRRRRPLQQGEGTKQQAADSIPTNQNNNDHDEVSPTCSNSKKKQRRHQNNKQQKRQPSIDILSLWQELNLDKEISPMEQERLLHCSWSQLKKTQATWLAALDLLAHGYNEHLRRNLDERAATKPKEPECPLPRLFRIEGEPDSAFYMCGALAQVPDEFPMRLFHSEPFLTIRTNEDHHQVEDHDDDSLLLDFKPSVTRCVVLHRGHIKTGPTTGNPFIDCQPNSSDSPQPPSQDCGTYLYEVTKVQLEPKTGRRHQLRVHMSQIAGHGIVGDATYSCNGTIRNNVDESSTAASSYSGRMCLHAHALKLPPLLNEMVSTPDPFPVDTETGEILVNSS